MRRTSDFYPTFEQHDLLLLAADLVRRRVDVIVTPGGTADAQAAKAATTSIPVVFTIGGDPIKLGLVASLSHPGDNVTGVTFFSNVLAAKRLTLLRDLMPSTATIAVLMNPTNANAVIDLEESQSAARAEHNDDVNCRQNRVAHLGTHEPTAVGQALHRVER